MVTLVFANGCTITGELVELGSITVVLWIDGEMSEFNLAYVDEII